MTARRWLSGFRLLLLVSPLLTSCSAEARSWGAERGARLPLADGSIEVALRPDHGPALALTPDGPHRWIFEGRTSPLVGGSYSIVLKNRTSERLKIVVGVDGLNVYGREVVAGSSAEDVGSIVQPWGERTLPGWQLDSDRAQRFVFSPPEWSEGEGRTESEIGIVSVQVYREWHPYPLGYEYEKDSAEGGARAERQRRNEPSGATAPAPPAARAPIGTASGDDVDSSVRTVRFVPATAFPEVWATIDYGNAERASHTRPRPRPREWDYELLGLDVDAAADGTRIVAVEPGSPADTAGLEVDDVIVRIDTAYAPSPSVTRRILRDKEPGEYAFVRVRRGRHELAVKIRS